MSASKNKDMAWKLVAFMTSVENNWDYVQQGFLPDPHGHPGDVDPERGARDEGDGGPGREWPPAAGPRGDLSRSGNLLAEEVQFVLLGQKTAADASGHLLQARRRPARGEIAE